MDYKIKYLKNDEIKEFIIPVIELTTKILPNENFEANHFYRDDLNFHHLLIWRKIEQNSKLFIKKLDAICSYIEYDKTIYLMLICLDENLQNKGIAKQLLNDVIKNNEFNKEIWVKIERNNEKSIKFFIKNNFKKRLKKSAPNVISKSYRKTYDLYCYNPTDY
jgi:hypothetical protein